ncbi:hypothetical protein [Aquimarina agarivorans]|uniref:hypothetical protein n=1 Tax=Aquimarina agarivorans TaxID=980584 RepID=UPI000248FCE7|nr:hypothetical protein [Aquimarina agarivorans]
MGEKKPHIDAIFKDKLQDFEAIPNAILWKEISKNIPKKRKKNNRLFFLLFPAGIAASVLLFFMLTTISNTKNEGIKTKTIVFEDTPCPVNITDKNTQTIVSTSKNSGTLNTTSKAPNNTENRMHQIIKKNRFSSPLNGNSNNYINKNEIVGTLNSAKESLKNRENLSKSEHSNSVAATTEDNALVGMQKHHVKVSSKKNEKPSKNLADHYTEKASNDALTQLLASSNQEENDSNTTPKQDKNWTIQPQIAPLTYNSISGGSPINNNFSENPQSYDAALSYGIRIAYQLTNKLQIRTGISTASINLATDNILATSLASSNQAILFNNSDQVSALLNTNNLGNPETPTNSERPTSEELENADIPTPDFNNPETDPIVSDTDDRRNLQSGTLQQQIDYVEIPFEIAYKLLDKKIGISLIGGVSSFILNQKNNKISFENNAAATAIGQARNLNNTSFSSNFGIGLDYEITPKIKFSVEPIFKLQLNAFDNNTDFDPYLFGIYSGIKFNL